MSVQIANLEEKNTVKLTIEVPAEDFEKAVQSVYNRQKKDISIPGFRKGKVPRKVLEQMYGAAIFYEDAANDLITEYYPIGAKESGLDIVSRPMVDVEQIEKGKPFIFTAVVAVKPEVVLGPYKGVEVYEVETTVTEEAVDKEIERERENNARIVSVEDRPVQEGDTAVIDYLGTIDGVPFDGGADEGHSLEIGSGSFIPGFEEQLIGANAGDHVEVNVTFPDDYHAPDLQGKDAVFAVTVQEIKTKELPQLDDEFAQDVSEYDTLEEYRESVRAKLQETFEQQAKDAQREEAVGKIVDAAEMYIPEAMLDGQCDMILNQFAQQMSSQGLSLDLYLQYTGSTIDQLKEEVRPEAEEQIRRELTLDQIVAEENIEVSDEELEAELERMAKMYGMEAEQLKGYLGEEEKEDIIANLASKKAMDLIEANMVVVPRPAAVQDEAAEAAGEEAEAGEEEVIAEEAEKPAEEAVED